MIIKDLVIVGFIIGFFSVGGFLLWASTLKIPDLQSFDQRIVAQSTKIYDRTGEVLLFDVHKNIQRTIIPFTDISRHIKNASVAVEDSEFYEHNGVRPLAIVRAVFLQPLRGKRVQGGSTITQQVVKNSILTSERKISRKLKEWILALKLEQNFSKEQILELYLNESPYGGNLYGVEEASWAFFGISASETTLAQAAYLAALPQAPTYYSPHGSHQEELDQRKNFVLRRMLEDGFITEDEHRQARTEEVAFQSQRNIGILAPHFVMFVREYLAEQYGERALQERGFRVITTLNFKLQEKAEEIVARFAEENTEKFNASNASLVAIDPKTGQILVMVGSRNYFDEEIDGNFNVTTAHRQPGSAFKPFVYATALNKGYTTETVVFDVRTQFSTTCDADDFTNEDTACYSPGNYDNIFRGPVTFRQALAQSINVPSVKVMYLAGLDNSLQTARSMGITSLSNIGRYGLTLVLGGGEVSLLDITSAYGVFANEGVRHTPVSILKIEDGEGNVVEEYSERGVRVLSDQITLQITDILSDNEARAPAFGSRSPLYFPSRSVAAKTGTTNDFRDAWIIGYTPAITVGAWAGNNDNSPMEKKVAGFTIAPLWNAFMQEAFLEIENEKFRRPAPQKIQELNPVLRGQWEGGESYFIDTISGKRATEYTPVELQEERFVKNVHSILYWIDKDSPRSPRPEHPEKDVQFNAWEHGVSVWKEKNNIQDEVSTSTGTSTIEIEFDDIHKPEFSPRITIISPNPQTLFSSNDTITITIGNESEFPLAKIDVFVNGVFLGSTTNEPFVYSFTISDITSVQQFNTLKLIGYDTVSNKGEVETVFRIGS